jgi:hypothetical protein
MDKSIKIMRAVKPLHSRLQQKVGVWKPASMKRGCLETRFNETWVSGNPLQPKVGAWRPLEIELTACLSAAVRSSGWKTSPYESTEGTFGFPCASADGEREKPMILVTTICGERIIHDCIKFSSCRAVELELDFDPGSPVLVLHEER